MELIGREFRCKHVTDPTPKAGMFSRHAHREYEFIYLIRGEVEIIIGQEHHRLKPRELVLIPPLSYHFIKIERSVPYERAVFLFTESKVPTETVEKLFSKPRVLDLTDRKELQSIFTRLDRYTADFEGEERVLLAENLLTELICLVSREEEERPLSLYYGDTVAPAVRYIEQHLTEIRNAEEICNALFISRSQLYQSFRDAFGIPPMKYVNEKRLVLAAAKIQVGEKPAQAAAACGFGDYSAFYRAYKKRFGRSPIAGKE